MSDDLASPTEVLLAVVEILNELRFDYFLCNGTLLGIVRDSKLIPWDIDLDIWLDNKIDKDLICAEFVNRGFELYDYGLESDYLILVSGDVKVDFNLFNQRGHELVTLWQVTRQGFIPRKVMSALHHLHLPPRLFKWCWTLEGYAVPTDMTLPTREIRFEGHAVRVPSNPEAVVAYIYGDTWKVPNKDYDWRKEGKNNAHG